MKIRTGLFVLCGVAAGATGYAQTPDDVVQRIRASTQFAQASTFIQADQDRFVRELIALTEIPAPPFKEQARAKAYMEMLRQQGLTRRRDGRRRQRHGGPPRRRAAGGPCSS